MTMVAAIASAISQALGDTRQSRAPPRAMATACSFMSPIAPPPKRPANPPITPAVIAWPRPRSLPTGPHLGRSPPPPDDGGTFQAPAPNDKDPGRWRELG